MDSSIVSFNNDSAFQNTLKPEHNMSVHELALHAMRDRCLLLQRRINALEVDNMRLKLDITKTTECSPYKPLQEDEKLLLHEKVAQLKKQKSQLMHHVFMVACENKNLWNKISNINKPDKPSKTELGKQPLLRTNTYIQSTPKTGANYQEKMPDSSLEEISLKLINSFIQEKSQMVEQYEQMTQLQDLDDDVLNIDSIGFAYMEEPTTDSLKDIKNQTEKLHNLKKDLAQQKEDLKSIITKVEKVVKEGHKCPSCVLRGTKSTTSEHKEIETSDSLANWATPVDSTNYNENYSELNTSAYKEETIIHDKQSTIEMEDPTDKICPMCGDTFPKDREFAEFQSHVENHFTGDIEPDSIMENFDRIPNSVDHMI